MHGNVFNQSLEFMLINLGYAVVCLFVSVIALIVIDKVIFKEIDFIKEIKNGNIAASLFQSVLLFFIGYVVSSSLN
ncbi:DUF350 domain-containing protein [Paraferrimonas sp. SM1919]|uniref:DUF350 domain-containing protein n=1 Tax=Paraferrimonas sp. SM1919 TaxID=2662263 RepID=UPI0013D86A0C|nr:DUF350 domain-containing protein [Paraferrimonas sp. SM1919]